MITRNTFKRSFIRLLTVGISLLAVVSLSRSVYGLWRKRDYVQQRASALAQEQAENDRLKKQVEESQKPEFIEKEAREKLGMTREGEAIVIMPNPPAGEAGDKLPMTNEKTEAITTKVIPNWKKWWGLFF